MSNRIRRFFRKPKSPNEPKVITISEGLPTKEALAQWDWGCYEHNGEVNQCKSCVWDVNGCSRTHMAKINNKI